MSKDVALIRGVCNQTCKQNFLLILLNISDIILKSQMSDSGSEDDSWDVDKYRVDYESEEHWELRKVNDLT